MQQYRDHARIELLQDREEQALFLNHCGERLTRQGLWVRVKRSRKVHALALQDLVTLATGQGVFRL